MFRLENTIQNYAWGSLTAIAGLQQRPPSGKREAELWLGAHPKASSLVSIEGREVALNTAIASDANRWIGELVASEFGAELPFLFKALAAETPLSLQAHPSITQARLGFAAENAAGVPIEAPHRNYRDRNHKPELICALTPFEALCGFRPITEARELYQLLNVHELVPFVASLSVEPANQAMRDTFFGLMSAPAETQQKISQTVAKRAAELVATATEAARDGAVKKYLSSLQWALRLFELYPGDVGVATSLLLNQVTLQPGQALYLPAGNLHAYLHGFGIELMANSDNVLRGGCTPKHVDVAELLKVLDFSCGVVPVLRTEVLEPGVSRYVTPAAEFELAVLTIRGELSPVKRRGSPEILLVTQGEVTVHNADGELELKQGDSAFVRAGASRCVFQGRDAVVYRAGVGKILA
jgi:mannose-6-phosphate isomerase